MAQKQSQNQGDIIRSFTLGNKELDGKTVQFQYDRGQYSITDVVGGERSVIYKSRNAQEAYTKWNVYIGRKKERPERQEKNAEGENRPEGAAGRQGRDENRKERGGSRKERENHREHGTDRGRSNKNDRKSGEKREGGNGGYDQGFTSSQEGGSREKGHHRGHRRRNHHKG